MKKNRSVWTARPAFTLIELMMVIAITVILLAAGLRGMVESQRSFLFNNAVERVLQIVREARSLAVTGKAQLDYTDYDQDGYDESTMPPNGPDYVTPANYGVNFNTGTGLVTLFADLHNGSKDNIQNEGVYDAPGVGIGQYDPAKGKDIILAQFSVDDTLSLILKPAATTTVMFSPIFADTTFNAALDPMADKFYFFGISELDGAQRKRCYKIHPIAGVPEVADPTECT